MSDQDVRAFIRPWAGASASVSQLRADVSGVFVVRSHVARPIDSFCCSEGTTASGRICVAALGLPLCPELEFPLAPEDGRAVPGTARICLHAYQRWHLQLPDHLTGDYLLTVWDGSSRAVMCFRPHFALRPIYYTQAAGHLLFASSLSPIILDPRVSRQPDLATISDYLTNDFPSPDATLYEGVFRLPPGHVLRADAKGVRVSAYPFGALGPPIRYRDPRDYAAHFLELAETAVRQRLPSDTGVGVMLSGGVDSAAVLGITSTVSAASPSPTPVQAFSLTFPGRDCDESHYSRHTCEYHGLAGAQVSYQPNHLPDLWSDCAQSGDIPFYPQFYMFSPLLSCAKTLGFNTLLTGEGADNFLSGSAYPYESLLRSGQVKGLLRTLYFRFRKFGIEQEFRRILRQCGWLLASPALLRWLLHRRQHRDQATLAARPFINSHRRSVPIEVLLDPGAFSNLAQWHTAFLGLNPSSRHLLEMLDRHDLQHGVQRRHPFFDERIFRFAVSIPDHLHHNVDRSKLLLRTLGPSVIPPEIASRKYFVHFTETYRDLLLQPAVRDIILSSRAAARDWLDDVPIQDIYNKATAPYCYHDTRQSRLLTQCWTWFAIELWWRVMFD